MWVSSDPTALLRSLSCQLTSWSELTNLKSLKDLNHELLQTSTWLRGKVAELSTIVSTVISVKSQVGKLKRLLPSSQMMKNWLKVRSTLKRQVGLHSTLGRRATSKSLNSSYRTKRWGTPTRDTVLTWELQSLATKSPIASGLMKAKFPFQNQNSARGRICTQRKRVSRGTSLSTDPRSRRMAKLSRLRRAPQRS